MKKLQLSFLREVFENQTLIITIEKDGIESDLQEIFIEDASNAGQTELSDYGGAVTSSNFPYSYLANNFNIAFKRDYNNSDFKNGLTITRKYDVLYLTSTDKTVVFKAVSGTAISSNVITYILSEPAPQPLPIQNLKYYFEFNDVVDVRHRVEILSAEFDGEPTEIYGNCSLEYSETDDTLEPIRGSGLKIDLEANTDLTFSDLYSEEERTYSVTYKRDTLGTNTTLFNGWLSPEGIYESLVSDKWVISLDCTDGLGFLKNLSYVEDATGLNFVGKQSLIKIISNCLTRTKIQSNIYAGINIYYNGLANDLSILENVFYNADRFVKDDKDTLMNCDEVLRSVLEPFGAVITAYKGAWMIYKPNTLVSANAHSYFGYDFSGDNLVLTSKLFDFTSILGSQINGFYPHHVNANQYKTIKSAIGAFRINYKYGLVEGLIANNYLASESNKIADFTINSFNNLTLGSDNLGVNMTTTIPAISSTVNLTSDIISLSVNDSISYLIKFKINSFNAQSGASSFAGFRYKIILSGESEYYYNVSNGVWENSSVTNVRNATTTVDLIIEENINMPPLPIDGDITIEILNLINFGNNVGSIFLQEISISATQGEGSIKGENHTFQRKLKPSSKIKDTKEVFNGDNPSDIYFGTIYKVDETTPTSIWNRKSFEDEEKPILRIMGEERMKMYSKPLQVYSGDVFGFFNYLNVATISNFNGVFMPTSYSYNCAANVTSITFVEILNTDILEDIDYQKTLDYGNVVEPTIKG
jgi:hypothetical protein